MNRGPERFAPVGEDVAVRGSVVDVEWLFSRHCAMCHDAGEVGIAYREALIEAAGAEFREFLVDHHGPSPDGIALIVRYLIELEVR